MSTIREVLEQKYHYEPAFPDQRIPPRESLIAHLEDEIRFKLPGEYREILISFGGMAPATVFDLTPSVWVPGLKDWRVADYLLGFYQPTPKAHLLRFDVAAAYHNWSPVIGESFLPIMKGTGEEDLFCLKLSGEGKHSVWGWLKDPVGIDTKWEDIRDIWGLYHIAADIKSFICSLQDFKY